MRPNNHVSSAQEAERKQEVMPGSKDSNPAIPDDILPPSNALSHEGPQSP